MSLLIVSFLIFTLFNVITLKLFGVPESLSNTFYLYQNKKKGLGWIFPICIVLTIGLLMPSWLTVADMLCSSLTILAFVSIVCVLLVGFSPCYKTENYDGNVHNISAVLGAACAILWCVLVCFDIILIPLVIAFAIGIAGLITKSWKTSAIYWLEIMAFAAIFICVFLNL